MSGRHRLKFSQKNYAIYDVYHPNLIEYILFLFQNNVQHGLKL